MEKHRDRMQERHTEMKDQHDKTSRKEDLPSLYTGQAVRIMHQQKKTWCPGNIVSKCVRRAKKLRGGNAKRHTVKTQSCTSSRARGLPGENCSVQRRTITPMQIVQQHVSDQPDTVDEADSRQLVQSEKEETTQCVASTRSGCRVRVQVRYQHN